MRRARPARPRSSYARSPLGSGNTATEVALAGDLLYVGTAAGHDRGVDLADPRHPTPVGRSVTIGAPVNAIAIAGFVLYAATPAGVAALDARRSAASGAAAGAAGRDDRARRRGERARRERGATLYVAAGRGRRHRRRRAARRRSRRCSATSRRRSRIDAVDVVLSDPAAARTGCSCSMRAAICGRQARQPRSRRASAASRTRRRGLHARPRVPRSDAERARSELVDPMTRTPSTIRRRSERAVVSSFRRATILTGGRRLARGAMWEQIGTLTGRRLRDSFMPGSGVLSLAVMQQMRGVKLCESTAASNGAGQPRRARLRRPELRRFGDVPAPRPGLVEPAPTRRAASSAAGRSHRSAAHQRTACDHARTRVRGCLAGLHHGDPAPRPAQSCKRRVQRISRCR